MCAKYSDFLCIWLRKCDFLTGKVRFWPDSDPKLFIPDPDPANSSGSDRIRIRIHNTGGRYGFWASDRKTPAAKALYWSIFALTFYESYIPTLYVMYCPFRISAKTPRKYFEFHSEHAFLLT